MDLTTAKIQTENLWKTYGEGETRVDALRGAELCVAEGEFVAILGPSGSGKSTLLHLVGGLDQPSQGRVLVDGTDIYQLSEAERSRFRRRKVGFIFQFYNLVPVLTVEENIALPLLLDGGRVDPASMDNLLGVLGLTDRRDHMPNELSGGQQQRTSIGRALMCQPDIILADEPTGNLDRTTGREVVELLRLSVREFHQTVLMITHDLDAATEADTVVTIEDGVLNGAGRVTV